MTEEAFERGFVAGWEARGRHEAALSLEAELAERKREEQEAQFIANLPKQSAFNAAIKGQKWGPDNA